MQCSDNNHHNAVARILQPRELLTIGTALYNNIMALLYYIEKIPRTGKYKTTWTILLTSTILSC